MDEELTKIPENAESKVFDRQRERYPVQQSVIRIPGELDLEAAVEEINPDTSSMEGRG